MAGSCTDAGDAGGPWVGSILEAVVGANSTDRVRLVRGSHIVTRRLFDHDRSYFLQGRDGRIIFAIPYEGRFTLIGTTDQDHPDSTIPPVCTDEEADYLLDFASQYFSTPLTRADIVWRFSGVRPLYDDAASSATAATRDYVLKVEDTDGAPLLNIFGGKITTYRKLAEAALAKIAPRLRNTHGPWTAAVSLPGGEFAPDGVKPRSKGSNRHFRSGPCLGTAPDPRLRHRGIRHSWGRQGHRRSWDGFRPQRDRAELDWVVANEWVTTGEDFLWRRTRLGLVMSAAEAEAVDSYVRQKA